MNIYTNMNIFVNIYEYIFSVFSLQSKFGQQTP